MKPTYLFLFILLIGLVSCEDNIDEINVPALQASRNGEFFGADAINATNNADGTVTIAGENPLENLRLVLTASTPGVYELGQGLPNEAIYTFNNQTQFTTRTGESTGSVVITSNEPVGTITGNFSYVSYTPNALDTLTMRKGVIYQVPFGTAVGFNDNDVNTLSATINGTLFTPSGLNTVSQAGTVIIEATNSTTTLLLSFPQEVTVGSYEITAGGAYRAVITNTNGTGGAVSGAINFTLVNPAAGVYSGSFNFETGPPSNLTVTQGSFNVTL